MLLMLLLLNICFAGGASLVAQPPTSIRRHHEWKNVVEGYSDAGRVSLPTAGVRIEINQSDGKTTFVDLFVIRDPSTGIYFWRHFELKDSTVRVSSASRLSEAEAIYAVPDAIYYFYLPAGLYVDRHFARASDLESAVKASIDEMKDNLQRHKMIEIKSHSSPGLKAMGSVGQDFSCPWPPTSPICPPSKNKIVSISRKEGNWILVLRRRYDQELVIDSAKKFVSTRKLSQGEIGEK